jgi:hypothetical protein
MTRTTERIGVTPPAGSHGGTNVVVQPRSPRYVPAPYPPWYENIPTWVSISIFLQGLALLLLVVLVASPGTFGIGDEGAVRRAGDAAASNDRRIVALEAQIGALTGTAAPAGAAATDAQLGQRLTGLESRVAQLCAGRTPPC